MKTIRRKIMLLFCFLAIGISVSAQELPFELNVIKEGGREVKLKGGLLGLKVVDEYKGYYSVEQLWVRDDGGTNICNVKCSGRGNEKCTVFISAGNVLSNTDVVIDDNKFNSILNELVEFSDLAITEEILSLKRTKKISVATKDGKRKVLVFNADYIFSSIDKGNIKITLNILDI